MAHSVQVNRRNYISFTVSAVVLTVKKSIASLVLFLSFFSSSSFLSLLHRRVSQLRHFSSRVHHTHAIGAYASTVCLEVFRFFKAHSPGAGQ